MRPLPLLLALSLAAPAFGGEDEQAEFVADNLVATFYHEMGHALIDHLELPVLGREEDAADILSVLLIDEVWETDAATTIAENTALAYVFTAADNADADPAFWDVHGLDLQRYYSHVCLFYGADPENREEFARNFELPIERAEGCAEEYQLALDSWWTYLDPLQEQAPGTAILKGDVEDEFAAEVIHEEIDALNERFDLPYEISVDIVACETVNAFYIPDESRILICTEYVDYLWQQAEVEDL
jgi:hypothetical protein